MSMPPTNLDALSISPIEGKPQYRHPKTSSLSSSLRSHSSLFHHPDHSGSGAASWVFTDILLSLTVKEKDDVYSVINKCNQLVRLLQESPSLKSDIAFEHVVSRIVFMFYHPAPQLRCAAYRVLRYSIVSADSIEFLVSSKILICIIVSLSTPTPLLEKQEALKLIRHFLLVPNGSNYISIGVVKALVALVEHENDSDNELHPSSSANGAQNPSSDYQERSLPLHFIKFCIETISELSLVKPHIAFHGGGLRLIISLVINGSPDIALPCMFVLVSLLDKPNARLFLRNGLDLASLTSVFSLFLDDDDVDLPNSNSRRYHNRALKISFLLSLFLKCWNGLICFSHKNFESLQILISNLKCKNTHLRNIILDLLLDVLLIKPLPWVQDSSVADLWARYYAYIKKSDHYQQVVTYKFPKLSPKSFEYTVISNYQGFLLKVLINCGIVPMVFEVIDSTVLDDSTSLKATFLLTNVLQMSTRLLPSAYYNTQLFDAYRRSLSMSSISKIESAAKSQMTSGLDDRKRNHIKSYVKDMIVTSRVLLDDADLKTLITQTRLLTGKEFEDWNWNQISHLCQGPLRSSKRFNDIQEKYPKLLKLLLSFFRPFKYRFSRIPLHPTDTKSTKLKNPKKLVSVGCQLIEALLKHEAGFRYLLTNKLMPQLAEIFAQVSPKSGISAEEPFLSTAMLESTLTVGYVKFVGILSSSQYGLQILEEWQFLHLISDIIQANAMNGANNQLVCNLFSSLNFHLKSPFRIILSQAMTTGQVETKVFLMVNIVPKLLEAEECQQFILRNLVNSLYDMNDIVVQQAIGHLHDFFIIHDRLAKINDLISLKPSVKKLMSCKEGRALILAFCTTTPGFRLLLENGIIEKYFHESIRQLQGCEYLLSVEETLQGSLVPFSKAVKTSEREEADDLHHFFHYLLATEDGFLFFNSNRRCLDEIITKTFLIVEKLGLIDSFVTTKFDESTTAALASHKKAKSTDLLNMDEYSTPTPSDSFDGTNDQSHSQLSKSSLHIFNRDIFKPSDDEEEYLLMRLKQNLWIIGEIASSKFGIQILDPLYSPASSPFNSHVLELILQLFQNSRVWQIRGVAFHQLGKLAATSEGVEMLDDMNWTCVDSLGTDQPLLIAYPSSLQDKNVFNLEILNPFQDSSYFLLYGGHDGSLWANQPLDLDEDVGAGAETFEKLNDKVLSLINHLSSVLGKIERKAMKELKAIKAESPQVFENPFLFLKTIRLVDKGKFKYKTRKFVFGLFNVIKIMEFFFKQNQRKLSKR